MIYSELLIFTLSVGAGLFGALLGLGGGIIIIPVLTLSLGVNIKYAIGASIVSVIATSSGAAITYVRDKITNLRIGMFLETATTLGAITGAFVAGYIHSKFLFILFGLLLLYSAFAMLNKISAKVQKPPEIEADPLAEKLKLNGYYYDKNLKEIVDYKVRGIYPGFGMMYFAGIASGLLGIGSGIFKVIAMDTFMKLPLKVASATSNFMIGVTAAASAGIYFARGDINPKIAAPVALGVLIGATLGTRLMQNLTSSTIRKMFIPVLLYVAIQMLVKGLGIQW